MGWSGHRLHNPGEDELPYRVLSWCFQRFFVCSSYSDAVISGGFPVIILQTKCFTILLPCYLFSIIFFVKHNAVLLQLKPLRSG